MQINSSIKDRLFNIKDLPAIPAVHDKIQNLTG